MAFEIFERELAVLKDATAVLEKGEIVDASDAQRYAQLIKDYEKLLKSSRRLVRLSDRTEEKLNKLARSFDEKNRMLEGLSVKLSKYLSPQVYHSIFSGEQDVVLSTKRKKLTVFFSDIKDFTGTTEHLQPEDLAEVLNRYFSEMSKIALQYGATIDKFIGDAMVMFFGDPESKGVQEDARICVQMAVAMQRRMRELEQIWRESGNEKPFRMRIGINTGYCNVGNFGSDQRMDYTIIGSEVNLAARLESKAKAGGILMSYETYALVRDMVDATERAPVKVKGIDREIRSFALNDIYDEKLSERRFLRNSREGMILLLDKDKLDQEGCQQAVTDLEAALHEIKGWLE